VERCYVGGQVGYGWGKAAESVVDTGTPTITTTTTVSISAFASTSPSSGSASGSTSGWIAGGQAGCNWRPIKDFIVGLEVEAWTSEIKGSAVNGTTSDVTFRIRNRWDADIAARLGIPLDGALLYVKGGVAEGHFDYTLQLFKGSLIGGESTRLGVLLGFGIEYALSHDLSIKGEYNYIDFGSSNVQLNFGNIVHVHDTRMSSKSA